MICFVKKVVRQIRVEVKASVLGKSDPLGLG